MVDTDILQIQVQGLMNRLPVLSQGDTAERAGAGMKGSSGLSLVGARAAFMHNHFWTAYFLLFNELSAIA